MNKIKEIEKGYRAAKDIYSQIDVDTDRAIEILEKIPISLHCWQGDDVSSFENSGDLSDSGLMVTGAYPGKACTADELRMDLDKALSLISGKHRLNLHAIYAETQGKKVYRNELRIKHFSNWINRIHIGLDFFDASINRVAAWVIGVLSMIKALLIALLEPIKQLKTFEKTGDFTSRLAMLEAIKTLPYGAVWNYYCLKSNVPIGVNWIREVKDYEKNNL